MSLSDELVQKIEAEFRKHDPEIANFAIEEIAEITGGWESPIYSFSLRFQRGSAHFQQGHVIRVYEGANAQAQAQKDFQIMTRVNQFGLPTPAIDFLIMNKDRVDEAYLLMEKIEGETAADFIQAGKDEGGEVLGRLAAYQARLHEMNWRQIWQPQDAEKFSSKGFARAKLENLRREIAQLGIPDFECCLAWLEERIPKESAELSLLHNDYHPENALLRNEDGALFLIDWGFAELGDARMDLAWSLLQVSLILGGHARAEYLAAYEDARGATVEHVEFFEALKFTERMATIAQWLQPDFEIPIRKIREDGLRGSYKVHITNVYARLKEITGCTIPLIEAL